MNDKLSIEELQTLYKELSPMFQSVLYQSEVTTLLTDITNGGQRAATRAKRDQQDKEDREKIGGALW